MKTWAKLKPETPFNRLFPNGLIPIRSPLPIIPREEGAPHCYLVPGNQLTEEQLRGLAELVWQQWQPECASLEQAIAYIRKDALPLKTDWFTGWGTADQGMMMSLADWGEEMLERSGCCDDDEQFEDDEAFFDSLDDDYEFEVVVEGDRNEYD